MEITWGMLWTAVAALGLPSALVGLMIRKFERRQISRETEQKQRQDEFEAKQEQREKDKQEFNILLLKSIDATSTMGEATADAVVTGVKNGKLTAAVDYNRRIKHEREEFMHRQGVAHFS